MFNIFKRKKEIQSSPSTLTEPSKQMNPLNEEKPFAPRDQPTGKIIEIAYRSVEAFTLENCPDNKDLRDLL